MDVALWCYKWMGLGWYPGANKRKDQTKMGDGGHDTTGI